MRRRDQTALALAPVFLRLALAVIFIWAGLGKLVGKAEFAGEDAAILANYGVIPNPHERAPVGLPDPAPVDDGQAADGRGMGGVRLVAWQPEDAPQGDPQETEAPEQPTEEAPAQDAPPPGAEPGPGPARVLATAADFPEPVSVRAYAGLVVLLHRAMNPGLNAEDSSPRQRLWPDLEPGRDYDHWPVWLAWAVSLTELIGGILVAIGLLTRIAALALAGVMVGALWLTVIGPAIQTGQTLLGFLPNHPAFSPEWQMPQFQFVLLCAAVALFFAGPGTLSLDRLFVGGPVRPAAKPAAAAEKK